MAPQWPQVMRPVKVLFLALFRLGLAVCCLTCSALSKSSLVMMGSWAPGVQFPEKETSPR